MANQKQLTILKKGVVAWNEWREENPKAKINLSKADLSDQDLSTVFLGKDYAPVSVNLANANLSEANFWRADFAGADFREADLSGADFTAATLFSADFRKADLFAASFVGALLDGASFQKANLESVILQRANLTFAAVYGAQFKYSTFGDTTIGNILDLRSARGLSKIRHSGPSVLGIDVIRQSMGQLPEAFLRGCGLSDLEIEEARLYNPDLSNDEITKILYRMYDLRASQAFQLSPVFISYSHADGKFVDKLGESLTEKGIRYWRDIHDMKAGPMEKQIDVAIRQNPTVLLVLSKRSLNSDWVQHEVRRARELEKEMSRDVLCPVALDDSWKNSSWPQRIMEQVTEYNILDFSTWKDDSKFGNTFNKLIEGLELFYKG